MNMPFIPIQGTEEIIGKQNLLAGSVYFATDSGKIFLDTEKERILVGGGGVAILYATAKSVSQDLTDLSYIIYTSDLEDQNASPKKDDLIINSNGTFYKVRSYNQSSGILKCSRIAVSGTGSGGGSGGSGDDDSSGGKYTELINIGTAPNAQTYIYGQSQIISFEVNATHDAIVTLNYYVTNVATGNTQTFTYTARTGSIHEFDLGAVVEKGQNTLVVEAIGSNSGSYQLQYPSIQCIELALKESSNFNPLKYAYNSDMSFHFIPVGTVRKTLNVYIDNNLEIEKELLATDNEQSMSVTISKKPHGIYTLKAELAYDTGAVTIRTDPLIYQIAFLGEDNDAPLIWFNNVPEKITNHDKLNIQYMVYDPVAPDRTSIRRYVNGKEIASLDNVAYSSTNWLIWNISNYELGDNEFTLQCGTTSTSIQVYVEKDELRDLDILTTDLYLNLTSVGRSNSENETQRQEWYYERSNGEISAVTFNNFNWYNNGWINDTTTGDSMLRISNGASIEIPVSVMNTRDLDTNLTFEIQFKLRNVQKYENLIEVTSEEIKDPTTGETTEVKVTKTVRSTDGVWCSYYDNDIGMCLGTQEGFFKSKQVIASGRYKEDDIVTISFVAEKAAATNQYPLIYMYINGIMSSIINYDKTSDSFAAGVKKLIINSDYCDVDVYKIRIYQAALSSSDIVHNYIADQNSAELYDMNQIVEFSNNIPTISFTKMKDYNAAHPDSPLQAYAVLECVDKTEDLLPYIKGGKKKVNVTFVNPSLDYAYSQGIITGEQYLRGCPSYEATNIEFDVQGTSSQGYPRRNYKGKFKKKDDNSWTYTSGPLAGKQIGEKNEYKGSEYKGFYMDNHYSETTFTWKADYMESSMTHNTGFASFVKTLYSKHPLQDYDSSIDVTDRRTTVYGFPMIVFQKKADGSYEFIGRYNYNLDKGCNNVIGFEDETAHPFVEGKTFKEVAECWELLNNQGGRTSFTISAFEAVDTSNKLTVLNDFEYRYHPDEDNIDDALDLKGDFANKTQNEINAFLLEKYSNLRKVAEWLESTNSLKATGEKLVDADGNEIVYTFGEKQFTTDTPEYRLAKFANEFNSWFDEEYCAIYFIMTELLLQYDSRGKNMMLATWGPQEVGGNYIWYPIFYDIDTQLGVNNSGVPSWEYYTEPSPFEGPGIFSTANSVLWYNFEYNFKETIKTYYKNIRKNNLTYTKLKGYYDYDPDVSKSYAMMGHRPVNIINVDEYWKYIAPTFSGFINTSGTISKDEGKRFYCLQGDRQLHRDLFLRNRFNFVDSKWLAGAYSQEGVPSELWIRCNANNYPQTSDKYLNRELTEDEISSGYEQAAYKENSLDADFTFKVTPYLQQYNSLWFDKVMMTFPTKWDGENPTTLTVTDEKQEAVEASRPLTQQIFYIGGGEYISSLGDLSRAYLDELILTSLKRLKDLHLGSDDVGYYNSQPIKTFSLGAHAYDTDGTPNPNAKSLLESVVLTNVTSLSGAIDVTGAEKLRELRALGTTLTGVSFADGGQIEVLHLPDTIVHLTFIEPVKLKGLISSVDAFKNSDGNFVNGIYIPGITTTGSLAKKTKIEKLQITGGNMGYSSYQLMKNLVDIKTTMQTDDTLTNDEGKPLSAADKRIAIALENVLWSPYKLVESGVALNESKTYVLKTENSTFEAYEPTETDWSANTLNGLVYELIEENDAEKDCLTDLTIIKMFIDPNNIGEITYDEEGKAKYPTVDDETLPNYFRDVTEYADGRTTYPYLSGDMYINNSVSNKISEYEIKQIIDNYYPDLNIFAANITPAYTLKMVEVINDEVAGTKQIIELQTVKYNPEDGEVYVNVTDIKASPSRLHHYFKGWSLTEDGEILTNDDINSLQFNSTNMIYTLYAVFDWDSYIATFYNGTEIVGQSEPVIYGNYFTEISTIPSSSEDESSLLLEERIAFKGWTDQKIDNPIVDNVEQANNLIINIGEVKAVEDKNFYAVFLKENVYDSILDNKYLIFTQNEDGSGYEIGLNTNYKLSGKITLPLTYSDKPVTAVAKKGFQGSKHNISHIFWDKNVESKLKTIQAEGFLDSATLKYFEFLNTIEKCESQSFAHTNLGLNSELPDSLLTIGPSAFANCADFKISEIGKNIQTIGATAFASTIRVENLIIGDKVTTVGNSAFASYAVPITSPSAVGLKKVVIGSNIASIGSDAFAPMNDAETYNTLVSITLNVEADAVSGAPWGASRAEITWNG